MWKSIKDHNPEPMINILVRDKYGAICIVRTDNTGQLPLYRYMMKTDSDFYYASKGAIEYWIELRSIKMLDINILYDSDK